MSRKSTARLWKSAKNPNQKWRDRITVTLPDGSSREVVGYGATKKAATDALYAKVDKLLGMESPSVRSQYTFGQMMEEFLERERIVKGWAKTTEFNYRRYYTTHLQTPLEGKLVLEVTADNIRLIVSGLLERGDVAIAKIVQAFVKRALYWLKEAYPELYADIKLKPEQLPPIRAAKTNAKPNPPIWTEGQVRMFLGYMRELYATRTFYAAYPFFNVALMAGLRTGEILGLERRNLVSKQVGDKHIWHLQVRQQYATIGGRSYRSAPKSRAGVRDVPIADTLAHVLQAHMERVDKHYVNAQPTPLIIPTAKGKQQSLTNMRSAKNAVIEELGLPMVHTHHMRKIFATHLTKRLIKQGTYNPKIVAKILGHANTKVALQVYTQIIDEDFSSALVDFAEDVEFTG